MTQHSTNAPSRNTTLPASAELRKAVPIASGFLDYFPDAVAAVAKLSYIGNEQHNPGKHLFWDRSKSKDEGDAMMRHFLMRGTLDSDGVPHSVKVAWRAMAHLQKEVEADPETYRDFFNLSTVAPAVTSRVPDPRYAAMINADQLR